MLKSGRQNALPVRINSVGGAWYRHTNIPVVGIDKKRKMITFATAHWRTGQMGLGIISELLSQSQQIIKTIEDAEEWRVHYVGFASDGWHPTAQDGAQNLVEGATQAHPWKTEGITLVNLEQMDRDFTTWRVSGTN